MKVPTSLLTRSLAAILVFGLCGICESATAFAQQAPQQTQQPIAGAPADQPAPTTTTAPADQSAPTSQQPNVQTPNTQQPTTVQDVPPATTQQGAPPTGSTVDPSQGPLAPVPTQSVPEAPSSAQPPAAQPQTQPVNGQPATQQQQQTQREPLGAAAAEGIRTAGGGASRPAGSAIAPAKQHQVRSFLIKLGAVAAAGVAIGTVYALSKGTSSTPPNTTGATATVR
jgi:hypothetical protein